jgi:hypothetical protein
MLGGRAAIHGRVKINPTFCHLERRPRELATKGKSKDPDHLSIAMRRQENPCSSVRRWTAFLACGDAANRWASPADVFEFACINNDHPANLSGE